MALTADGLTIERLPEVLAAIEEAERINIDPNISVASDTILGQLNNIFAESIANLNALAEAVYDSFNVQKAEGKSLDDLAALRGITRSPATRSFTNSQLFTGNNGVVIPAGSIFANPVSTDRFNNPASVRLDAGSCLSADLVVSDVRNSTEYSIRVNDTEYTYTSSIAATPTEILTEFETLINDDVNTYWSATLNGTTLTIESDTEERFSVVTITFISISSVTVDGTVRAIEFGDIVSPAGSITQIVSIVSGLTSTTNQEPVIVGRDEETDEELRERIQNTGNADCTGTIPSIEAALLNNVSGVSAATASENTFFTYTVNVSSVSGTFLAGEEITGGTSGATGTIIEVIDADTFRVNPLDLDFQEGETITGVTSGATGDIDEYFPPHSYEVVVVGGSDEDVAQEIWRTKPAGIALYGNSSEVIVDSNGNNRTIYFTRATAVNIAVRVTYTRYDEESFPPTGNDLIRTATINYINDLDIGEDVIPGRLFGPIYNSTTGIEGLTVEIQTLANQGDAPNPGNWQTTSIAIDPNEFANTATSDVTVIDATP